MSNIIDSIQLSGTVYSISGGGSTYTAGRGINITNDTISVSLPVSAGSGTYSVAEGRYTYADGNYSHSEGIYSAAEGNYSHAEGYSTIAQGAYSHTEGNGTQAYNEAEHASGKFNISNTSGTDANKTLFSVGNGTADNARHNAFEIKQNGDIYLSSGGTDIKLQDHLGGGGGGVPESAFTAYTAATDARIAEDEEVTAAALNELNEAISGVSGNNVVELTQAEYDALVTGGTVDPTAFYIITDATAGDLTQYWTSAQTQSAIASAVSTKQDTLVSGTNIKTINNESILGSGNIDIQGGGKAIEAGTNISVTTGETADTINCTLPFSYEGDNLKTTVSGNSFVDYFHYGQIFGINNTLQGKNSVTRPIAEKTTIIGYSNQSLRMGNSIVIGSSNNLGNIYCNNNNNYVFGFSNTVNPVNTQDNIANNNFVIGNNNTINQKSNNFIFGYGIKPSNNDEFSLGKYNNSVSGSSTFGDSGNTLFSVGNGTADNARHNAFEIRQNGDIYLTKDGQDVKLQDQLGGGGGTVDQTIISGSTNAVAGGAVYDKFDEVEQVTAAALNNINDRLSEDEEVTAAGLNAVNDKFGGLKLMKISQSNYDNLQVKDQNTLYIIVN